MEVTSSFQPDLVNRCEYYFFFLRAYTFERLLLCHANWSGVKRDLNVEKCSSIGPQGIVIIKHSNISVECHVYINK